MIRTLFGILFLLFGNSVTFADENGQEKSATPAEQYAALMKEFNAAARGIWTATNDDERKQSAMRGEPLPLEFLKLAEKYPTDPIALDALTSVLTVEIWLENNTQHPGFGNDSREVRAIAILIRDHVGSDRIDDACKRASGGFRRECETLLRAVLEKSPHRDVRGLACMRLAQFLAGRMMKLDLLQDQPDRSIRYERFFTKDYIDELKRLGRSNVIRETEELFERALEQYGDVNVPFGGTVGETAKAALHEIRVLAVGKVAPDIEGVDQDGKQFKLSDYRGKVVLLYFWSEF